MDPEARTRWRDIDFLSVITLPHFQGDRPEVPNVLIILTDGQSEDRVQLPVQVSKDHNVTVYVIGTLEANPEYLKNLSGKPENVFQLTSSANTPLASQLADRIDRLGGGKGENNREIRIL